VYAVAVSVVLRYQRMQLLTTNSVKKEKKEERFDPGIVAAVEAKLRAFQVEDNPPTSKPEAV
jgi:hypothetical protein